MVDITQLGEQDWEIYREVRLSALEDAPSAFGSLLATEQNFTEAEWRDRLSHRTQFLANEAGRPIGTVGCLAQSDSIVELVSMWVAPSARGTGVADLLVDAVLEEARHRRCATVVAWIAESNRAAERLYARHGFERTSRVQPVDADDAERGVEFEMQRLEPRR